MTKEYPKISIITPNYNNAVYLEDTIRSVLSQGYDNLEYIIIDGGSTDDSVNIIKRYEKHLYYWVSEKDLGQSDAINKGIQKSTGDIVAWLNSDDTYPSNALNIVSEAFLSNNSDVIYGDVRMFGKGADQIYHNPLYDFKDFFSRVSIHQPGVFWKRYLHDKLGYLDTSLHYCFDYDFWMRMFPNNKLKIKKIDNILADFRLHDNSKTISNPREMYLEYRQVLCRFFNSLPSHSGIVEKLNKFNIYFNASNFLYNIEYTLKEEELQSIVDIYIDNIIEQEYSFGNLLNTNRIIFLNREIFMRNILILLKNNLLIKKYK